MNEAVLALEDGRYFVGRAFGARGTVTGEVCFNTSMTGYQEILSDPSYRGQIVAMTYPQIGNYGANKVDNESEVPHVRAFVIEELSPIRSNWRSIETLEEYLDRYGIPGIQDVDTRALTKHLRTRGAMKGCLSTEGISPERAIEIAKNSQGLEGIDFVQEVTPTAPYEWDPGDVLSRPWEQTRGSIGLESESKEEDSFGVLPPVRFRIAALDCGMKKHILRKLRQQGLKVTVYPATSTADEILASNPDGIFLSNGPGDPAALDYLHGTVRNLIGRKPIFGICLGHQVLAYALGGKTFKLKFGHRGANQPVKDLRTGKVAITSQNHGYAVERDSLPKEVEVTHINLNDNTIAGLSHKEWDAFSVQYHPEAAPGPHDASYFFEQFARVMESK